jgi:hypothetical protein
MIMGGMAKISSGGFRDVLTIQMKGRIIKNETAIRKVYIRKSVSQTESLCVFITAS